MRLEFDKGKQALNWEKHGLDFVDSLKVLDALYFRRVAGLEPDGTTVRYFILGKLGQRHIVLVCNMTRAVLRPISFRPADSEEADVYEAAVRRLV